MKAKLRLYRIAYHREIRTLKLITGVLVAIFIYSKIFLV